MAYRTIEIQLIPETFGLLIFGLAGMMKAKPDITDDELATLIAQTLRLDMTVIDPPPWPEHPDAPSPDAVLRWRDSVSLGAGWHSAAMLTAISSGVFSLDIQPYGHVHGVKRRLGIPASSMRSRAPWRSCAAEPMNPTYANGWQEHLLQHGEIVPMAVRHDEDVITLVKEQVAL